MQAEHIAIAAGVGLIALVSASIFEAATAIASFVLGTAMLAITVFDARAFRIPDAISIPMIPAGLLAAYTLGASSETLLEHAAYAAIAAAAFYGLNFAFRRIRGRDGLGLGDVKLVAVAGAWTGPGTAIVILAAAVTAIAVVLLSAVRDGREVTRDDAIPFGVFLAPAIWLVWCLQNTASVT